MPGGAANALNYPVQNVLIGNGQGFSTTEPAFGFAGGDLGPDNRISWYVGDSWKIRPNFTVTYGIRYVRDTGRTDSDLAPIAALNQFNNQFYSGLGNRVNNPNKNFAPQLGIAWDPWNNGKTVLRGGIGLFYENSIFNNVLFDRPARLANGTFLSIVPACNNGGQFRSASLTVPRSHPHSAGSPSDRCKRRLPAFKRNIRLRHRLSVRDRIRTL